MLRFLINSRLANSLASKKALILCRFNSSVLIGGFGMGGGINEKRQTSGE
jgi:hypothetical protein